MGVIVRPKKEDNPAFSGRHDLNFVNKNDMSQPSPKPGFQWPVSNTHISKVLQ